MASLQITTAILGFGLAAAILLLLRRDHLYLIHGFFWFLVAGLAMFLGLWPGLIDRVAAMAGIGYPPALLFLGAAMVLIIKALHTDIVNTRIERQVRRLNQRLALYEMGKVNSGASDHLPPD
jgi:hypothetical protein